MPFDPISYSLAKKIKKSLETHISITPIDHPDESVTRVKLEYPNVDVEFAYLLSIAKLLASRRFKPASAKILGFYTVDSFADKAVEYFARHLSHILGRLQDVSNFYLLGINILVTTADFRLAKCVAGTWTLLGYEAVDLLDEFHLTKLSIIGTTLKGYREDFVTPKISVTNTTFASGYYGVDHHLERPNAGMLGAYLRAPSSQSLTPIKFFKVPIVGDGSEENPYRPKMPEELVEIEPYGLVNLLSLSHTALIPTVNGTPKFDYCIVRIFPQPDRQEHLKPINKCIKALKGMPDVEELKRGEAIGKALVMDEKLHLFDLISIETPTKEQIKEYIKHRKNKFGIEMSEEDAERYLKLKKGW